MIKILQLQSLTKENSKFDSKFTGVDLTPLNVGDSIDLCHGMSQTGFVRFIPANKNVFLDTRLGEWTEITTLTGQFLVVRREEKS